MKLNEMDAAIIAFLQGDMPIQSDPFAKLAKELEISEEELLARINQLKTSGVMRRFGAVLRHQQAGYRANAMVAWQVAPEKADQAGEMMAGRKEISHCYLREVPDDFQYQLFTMIHARNEQELQDTISLVADLTGLRDYAVLKSLREFKKVSMRYI